MFWNCAFRVGVAAGVVLGLIGELHAKLAYEPGTTSDGFRYLVVAGEFSHDDRLSEFSAVVRSQEPSIITFNSPGGNVFKAIELGRMIRVLGLSTIQLRGVDCISACALAFLGGTSRFAEPGSIGVHRSSFSEGHQLSADDAVSTIQALTAEIMDYMIEMGADPGLMQLSLRYDASDIRFLSGSEMEEYRIVTSGMDQSAGELSTTAPPPPANPPVASAPASSPQPGPSLTAPEARTGRVRHPQGEVPVKALAEESSPNIAILRNGTPLRILSDEDRWYRVSGGGHFGYMHHTWVFVDQFERGPFEQRHIQIKSVSNLSDALAYARSSSLPLAVYVATNGWFAITLEDTFEEEIARQLVRKLKEQKAIPDDSFITYGNTYVRQACCW